ARHLPAGAAPAPAEPAAQADASAAYRQLGLLMEAFGSVRQVREVLHGLLQTCRADLDRKSTRLNSSHVKSSYAVFCLKKKIHSHRLLGGGQTAAHQDKAYKSFPLKQSWSWGWQGYAETARSHPPTAVRQASPSSRSSLQSLLLYQY